MTRVLRGGVCIALLALIFVAGGCAGRELSGDAVLVHGPLPYDVGVFIDPENLPFVLPSSGEAADGEVADGEATDGEAADGEAADGEAADGEQQYAHYVTGGDGDAMVLQWVSEAIVRERPVVARVRRLDARQRAEALRQANDLDLLVAIGFEAPEEFPYGGASWPWATLEGVTWLFGGIPSWFVPTLRYTAGVRLTIEGIDLHQDRVKQWLAGGGGEAVPEFDWQETFEVASQNVSLFDRSSMTERPQDYLFTIIIPPSVVSAKDSRRLSESITEAVNEDLSDQLRERLKARLLEEDWVKPLRVAFLSPSPEETITGGATRLDLAIASLNAVAIERIEVTRQAEDGELFRWRAQPADLARLAESTRQLAFPGDFVTFSPSDSIPLSAGANTLKVSLERQDGERAVRTMLYFRQEEP